MTTISSISNSSPLVVSSGTDDKVDSLRFRLLESDSKALNLESCRNRIDIAAAAKLQQDLEKGKKENNKKRKRPATTSNVLSIRECLLDVGFTENQASNRTMQTRVRRRVQELKHPEPKKQQKKPQRKQRKGATQKKEFPPSVSAKVPSIVRFPSKYDNDDDDVSVLTANWCDDIVDDDADDFTVDKMYRHNFEHHRRRNSLPTYIRTMNHLQGAMVHPPPASRGSFHLRSSTPRSLPSSTMPMTSILDIPPRPVSATSVLPPSTVSVANSPLLFPPSRSPIITASSCGSSRMFDLLHHEQEQQRRRLAHEEMMLRSSIQRRLSLPTPVVGVASELQNFVRFHATSLPLSPFDPMQILPHSTSTNTATWNNCALPCWGSSTSTNAPTAVRRRSFDWASSTPPPFSTSLSSQYHGAFHDPLSSNKIPRLSSFGIGY